MSTTATSDLFTRPARPRALAIRRGMRSRRIQVGGALLMFIVIIALAGPLFAPYSPTVSVGAPFELPNSKALLGTDEIGRDVLSRVLYGGESVLWMSVAATAIGVGLGTVIGLLAGYSRSWVDGALMRPLDILLGFPQLVLVLLFVSVFGPSLPLIVFLVGLSWVPAVARVTRGMTLEIVRKEYVEAVEVLGVSRTYILLREVLPNIATPLLVEFGLRLSWSIAVIAGLGFLGFGLQPPAADWGVMINENRPGIGTQPFAAGSPAFCIAVFAIGANLVAEGIARLIASKEDAG